MANVRDFGATGDGRTDDTEAILHALNDGDGVLEFPRGTYRISATIPLQTSRLGYVGVRGDAGATRVLMTAAGPAFRVIGDHQGSALPRTVKPHTWEKERFPVLSDLEILGEHPDAVGIELYRTMQATISRVAIRNCRIGIHLPERNRNVIIGDCQIYDNSEFGVFFDRCNLHQIIIHGSHISYNKRAGIKSLGGDVHNLQITGNDIEYNNSPDDSTAAPGEPRGAEIWFDARDGIISEVTIASNTIQATVQPGGANVRIWGGENPTAYGARLIAITGNVLGSQTRGLDLRWAHRVTISGNTIYDNPDLSVFAANCSAISLSGNTHSWRGGVHAGLRDALCFEDCDNCSLTGLVLEDSGQQRGEQGGAVMMLRCADMAVSNCQIVDPHLRGIDLHDCRRCRLSDNSIVDRREPAALQEAIRVTGAGGGHLIQHNLIHAATRPAINAVKDGSLIQGNFETV